MLVSIIDRMMFGDRQITADGYLATVGKISKSGTQEYLGSELGRPEMDRVTVYRDADEVFDEDAIRSFAYKPVTDDHPPVAVTSKNWRTYSRGQLGGKALRDGEHLEFPMVVMDQGLIDKINGGKAELSAGYTAEIEFTDGVAPDGTPYQAKMTKIRGNHCAVVDRGRALTARIGDAWPVDVEDASPSRKKELSVKKLTFGDIAVSIDDHDAVESGVNSLKASLADAQAATAAAIAAKDAAETKAATDATTAAQALADAQAQIATLTAEKATLSQELADARDPAKLRDAAAEYGKVVEKAKAMGVTVADDDSLATVKRNAVNAKLGDVAKDWTDAQVDVSFATLSVAAPSQQSDPYRHAMGDRKVVDIADAAVKAKVARDEMIAGFNKRSRADAE